MSFTSIGEVLVPSGVTVRDIVTGAYLPDRGISVLTGPSAHGKSGLALQIAMARAATQAGPVVYFSGEAPASLVTERALTTLARVDRHQLAAQGAERIPGAQEALIAASERLQALPLLIDDTASTVTRLRAECQSLGREIPLALIVVDYAQLYTLTGWSSEGDHPLEIAAAFRSLADESGAPVLLVVGLEARAATEENPRPTLTELGPWAALADGAASVLLLHRPDAHLPGAQDRAGPIRLHLLRHPRGEAQLVGTIEPRIRWIEPVSPLDTGGLTSPPTMDPAPDR